MSYSVLIGKAHIPVFTPLSAVVEMGGATARPVIFPDSTSCWRGKCHKKDLSREANVVSGGHLARCNAE
jgi:hypothetical protein